MVRRVETYNSIHNHTDWSNALLGFPDSVNKTQTLIQKAYDLGLSGIAITEHEGVSNHITALKYYNEMDKERLFKLILGNEIYLMSEEEDNHNRNITTKEEEYVPYYHFILNALNNKGHEQLRKLSSKAWGRAYTFKNLMRRPTYYSDIEEIVGEEKGNIIASTACLGGYLAKNIVNYYLYKTDDKGLEKAVNFIKWGVKTFGENNFFLEMQPCYSTNAEQKIVNETLWELSHQYNIKIICTTDSHYLNKEQAFVHKVMLNAKDGGGEREVDDFYATTYLMSAEELREYLKISFSDEQIDEIFQNSLDILDRVEEYSFEHTPMIPQIPNDKLPYFEITHRYKQYYSKYPHFSYYANTDNLQDKFFFSKIEQSLYDLIENQNKNIEKYISRLNDEFNELHLISDAFNDSMASYYTTMAQIIDLIWETDSLSMPARGSGAGFLVCYLFGITQIDPVPLGDYFPFWRHLSAERGVEIADIDNDSQNAKRNEIIEAIRNYFGADRVLNVATFSVLSPKLAIEKAGKGLKKLGVDINDGTIGYMKSLVPIERGTSWTLSDCYYGNEEKGRKKVQELINEVEKYPHFKECMFAFEGLVINRGVHASGVVIGNNPYTDQISAIRSPNGVLCTCFDLHDSEYCGWTKVDILTIQASDKIRKTMDLLIENGKMEWQGNLKKTYWKYLHPDKLEYNNQEMWNMIKSIYSIFQFDTPVAVKALNQVEPHSVMDLSATNSLLRLMGDGDKETPLEKYTKYKNDITEWYKDMTEYGLSQEEQNCLIDHLKGSYGLADSQEKVMLLSMDKRVSGFTLKQANKLRKAIAKKKADVLAETKELFFNSCQSQGTSEKMAQYVWEEEFGMSFGYSFSQLHSYSYSIIALQELNLNYFYPPIYWNTACLTVESQSDEDNDKAKGNADYGKMAKAIYKMKKFNVEVLPPDINKSGVSFTPNEENNSILFGLGGISGINLDIAKEIIDKRPYKNFKDFFNKHNYKGSIITKSKFVALIKSGCFDKTDNKVNAMKWLIVLTSPAKTSLTVANLPKAIELGVKFTPQLLKVYNFKKYVLSKKFYQGQNEKFKSKKDYIVEPKYALPYFNTHCLDMLTEEKDYYYNEQGDLVVTDKSLEKALQQPLDLLKQELMQQKVIDEYNKLLWNEIYNQTVKNNNLTKWGFETLSYYPYNEHELSNIDFNTYNISHFSDLPTEPTFVTKTFRNKSWKQYDISRICGTVVDKKDNGHFITILTPDQEIVAVKFNEGQYNYYKQNITIGEEKDESYFTRGTLLLISGYRRDEEEFVAKRYKNTIFNHTLIKILKVNDDNTLDLQIDRLSEDEIS